MTSFISILLILSSKNICSVLQTLLIGPNSEERSCWTMSQKIVGPNKTVEINDSKLGWRKYNRGHKVKGQWVFDGDERESVSGQTADTLMALLS